MKQIICLSTLLIFISTACEKFEIKHDIIGNWKLVASGGGITGQGSSLMYDYLILKKTNDYQLTKNDTIIEQGDYHISNNEIESFMDTFPYKIYFSPNFSSFQSSDKLYPYILLIELISIDTLFLHQPLDDGITLYYYKE